MSNPTSNSLSSSKLLPYISMNNLPYLSVFINTLSISLCSIIFIFFIASSIYESNNIG